MTNTDAPHDATRTSEIAHAHGDTTTVGLRSILERAVGSLRSRPHLFVPSLVAGLVNAVATFGLLSVDIPVGVATFPDRGRFHLPISFLPGLESTIELAPGALMGLKQPLLVALVGGAVAVVFTAAVAFAVVLWVADPNVTGVVPPLNRLAWLGVYVLGVQLPLLGLPFWLGSGDVSVPSLLGVIVLALSVGLVLTPAFVVLDGQTPIRAAVASVACVLDRPISIPILALGLGYLEYVLSGSAFVVPSVVGGPSFGTLVSVTIGGTVHAVAVAVVYHTR